MLFVCINYHFSKINVVKKYHRTFDAVHLLFFFHLLTILSRDATSYLSLSGFIVSPSDTVTYSGSFWRGSEEPEAVSTRQPPLL